MIFILKSVAAFILIATIFNSSELNNKQHNGSWVSATGMAYPLGGSGMFELDQVGIKDKETIHKYGTGRAAGVVHTWNEEGSMKNEQGRRCGILF